jgi:DUF971 family protein
MSDAAIRTPDQIPDSITLSADRAWLSASWPDGTQVRLAAGYLRSACRCGFCTRARADGQPPGGNGITIVGIDARGPNVGRLVFSDGHDRGLYPWAWLLELAAANTTATEVRS